MDYRPAEFVRFVDPGEDPEELLNEAKADSWTKGREHAMIVVSDQRLLLVRGGRDGVELLRKDDGLYVTTPEGELKVVKLAWHIHPRVTGPSDHDRAVLRLLNQEQSIVYEINGHPDGTRFGAEKERP